MEKLYQRINYENSPSKKTPLSEANLNKMDKALDDLDNRIIEQNAAFAKSIEEEDKKIEEVKGKVSGLTDTTASLIQSKADAITVKKSGTTIVATDSSDKGFEQFKTFGKSEQEKTSGKNKIPVSEFETNTDGYTSEYMNPPVLDAGKTYILSGSTTDGVALTNNNCQIIWRDEANNVIVSSNEASWTTGVNYGQIENAVTFEVFTTLTGKKVQIQLEEGNVATPYEHYTNGPTPNPEYPQPIVSAGQMLAKGNQLIEPKLQSATLNGITLTHNGNGVYVINGEATAEVTFRIDQSVFNGIDNLKNYDGTYTISVDRNADGNVYAFLMQEGTWSTKVRSDNIPSGTFTAEKCFVCIGVKAGAKLSNYVVKSMLNEGSTALPWEPYTAGVKKAVDVGIQKKLTGKNLLNVVDLICTTFDKTTGTIKSITTNNTGQNVKALMYKGSEYIDVCFNVTKVGSNQFSFVKHSGYDVMKIGFNGDKQDAVIVCDISNLKNGASYKLVFTVDSLSQNSSSMSGVMVVEDSVTDDTYEPYTEQTLTINRVFRGIPVTDSTLANYTDENGQMWVADYADVERKVWVQRVFTEVFDGSENWLISETASDQGYTGVFNSGQRAIGITYGAIHMSNYFKLGMEVGYGDKYGLFDLNYNQFRFNRSGLETVDEWKAKLAEWHNAGTPLTVTYPLATPIETPMTDEEIIAYDALHTNKSTTIITNDAGCFMEVEYVADTKTHIVQNYVPVTAFNDVLERISALEQLHV